MSDQHPPNKGIDRRKFLKNSAIGAGGLALAGLSSMRTFGRSAAEKPNILIFMADDMTYHDTPRYGNEQIRAPQLNLLMSQGMHFNYAFNSAPMCAPTRMSLYTGIHPVRNGAWPNHSKVYPDIQSIPHYLRPLDYDVAILGKRHEAPIENFPFIDLGGRHHDGGRGEDLDLDKARIFMEGHASDPWCLVVSSNQPHGPWNRGTDTYSYNPDEIKVPPYLVDTPETRRAMSRYYAEISYMDHQLGTVLQHLDETGQAGNTLVIFLSEQGSHLPHCKWTCYDTGVRSAAVVRWPGVVESGTETDAMIQYVDVVPTILEAAGGSPAEHDFDGESFLPVLTDERNTHHEYAFSEQTSKGIYNGPEAYGIRTVRSKNYRLIWNLNHENEFSNLVTGGLGPYDSWQRKADEGDAFAQWRVAWYKKRPEFELYDNRSDPYEIYNLAENPHYQDVRKRLKNELDQWMEQQGDQGAETERNALKRLSEDRPWTNSIEPAGNDQLQNFELKKNYPNPFNPTTEIRFTLPQATEVQLAVFDMLGRRVATLVDGKRNSGVHSVTFDASGLSSGVYVYKMQAGNYSQSRKMLLVK